MDTSVPQVLTGSKESHSRSNAGVGDLRSTAACESSSHLGDGRGELAVVTELASKLPVSDAERQLVSAYLGELIRQILLEPE